MRLTRKALRPRLPQEAADMGSKYFIGRRGTSLLPSELRALLIFEEVSQLLTRCSVVFVHGLSGDRERTWTGTEGPTRVLWPEKLLPAKIPGARISTYGYDADYATFWRMQSQNNVANHASNLVTDLANMRDEDETVCLHSQVTRYQWSLDIDINGRGRPRYLYSLWLTA